MLKTLISQTKKLYNLSRIKSVEKLAHISEHEDFQNLQETLNAITQESIESKNQFKFDQIFKYGVNAFLPIFEHENYNIGIFFVPKGSSIPLHDHPQMIVFSRVLMGVLKYISLDFYDSKIQIELPKKLYNFKPIDDFDTQIIKAKLNSKGIAKINDIFYLTPSFGNIHQFDAEENSAILDVFIPNYDLKDRFCNFYEIKEMKDNDILLKYLFPPPADYECFNLDLKIKL